MESPGIEERSEQGYFTAVLTETTPLLGTPSPIDQRPWYRKASPGWLVPGILLMAMSMGSVVASKMELYNALACRAVLGDSATAIQTPSGPGSLLVLVGSGLDMNICRHDVRVQRKVTELNMVLTLVMGIFSAATTGWWGALSDRKGRKPVLAATQLGFLIADLVFLAVVVYADVLPYKLLIVGPIIDGLFGGWATAQAVFGSYISDCTAQGSRATVFAYFLAFIFAGFALGPTFGSILINWSGSVLTPFWVAAVLHLTHLLCISLFVPESRRPEMLAAAQSRYDNEAKISPNEYGSIVSRGRRNLSAVLVPLTVFLPRSPESISADQRSLLRPVTKRSYALTLIGFAYALGSMSQSIYPVKMQYAQYRFNWGPQENGYLLTLAGVARCIVLTTVLPIVTRMLRTSPAQQALKESVTAQANSDQVTHEVADFRAKLLHDSHFDLLLSRGSFIFDLAGYFIILLSPSSSGFIVGSALAAFGVGASPAIQSLALTLSAAEDSGKVLAALSVLQSIAGQIAGPIIYNATFALSLEHFSPATVFAVAASIFATALLALLAVRLAGTHDMAHDNTS